MSLTIPQIVIPDKNIRCPLCYKEVTRQSFKARANELAIGHYECQNCGTQFDVSMIENIMIDNKITYRILGINNLVYHRYNFNPSSRNSKP